MLEERRGFIDDGQVRDKYEFVTTTLVMDVYDQVVECDSTGGAFTVTLPNVAEAKGKMYSISLIVDNGDVTIQDNDESRDWADLVMTAANDYALVYSDGRKWFTLDSQLT